jgi:hypothetical protein
MIPTAETVDLESDFEIEQEPSKTFMIDYQNGRIVGTVDELEAVKQAVYLILNVERYEHLIYSWDYGVELRDLYGQPIPFVLPELKRRFTEALTQDERVQSVDAFSFKVAKGQVHCSFSVQTIFGDFEAERTVII